MAHGRSKQSGAAPPRRRDRLIREHEHDTYKVRGKLPDPTACTGCGAMYRAGRWTWGAPPVDAHRTLCPACHRIQDDYPGGSLAVGGAFAREHREELLGLARHVEEREKAEHPLKRIMSIGDGDDEILVTTTDPELARAIGHAFQRAYEGELDFQYSEETRFLRVTWTR